MLQHVSDTIVLADELCKELQQPSDVNVVTEILANHKQLLTLLRNRDQDMKNTIRALSGSVDTLEQAAKDPPATRVQRHKEDLSRKVSEVQGTIREMEHQLHARRGHVVVLAAQTNRDLERQMSANSAPAAAVGVKNTVKLCTNVTNVTWDYDSEGVKGLCHLVNSKAIKPFSFSAAAPRADVANAIWDLCWQDYSARDSAQARSPLPPPAQGTRVA